jgi:hypothetical protein
MFSKTWLSDGHTDGRGALVRRRTGAGCAGDGRGGLLESPATSHSQGSRPMNGRGGAIKWPTNTPPCSPRINTSTISAAVHRAAAVDARAPASGTAVLNQKRQTSHRGTGIRGKLLSRAPSRPPVVRHRMITGFTNQSQPDQPPSAPPAAHARTSLPIPPPRDFHSRKPKPFPSLPGDGIGTEMETTGRLVAARVL